MDLWIRSQDKTTIIRPVSISLDNLRTSIFGYYCGDYYKVLGTYKTKERTLEVLDEIQTLIEEYYDCLDNKIVLAPVYNMPKE